jgi:hypothetical protein
MALMLSRHRLEIVLVSAVVILGAFWARFEYIPPFPDRQVDVSEEKYSFDVGEPSQWFSAWSVGDGQAYVLIALDPSGRKLAEEIPEAGYRFARSGYGWAGFVVSFGQDDFVPQALAIVGGLAVLGVLLAAISLRDRVGPRVWLLVLNPALYIGFAGDTAEPLGILLLILGMATSSWLAAALLGVTRPTYLIALWGRWRAVAIGLAAVVLVALYGLVVFGPGAMVPDAGRLGLPLVGYLSEPNLWGFALLASALVTVVLGVRARDWGWLLAGVFVLCFGHLVAEDPINSWRAAGFLPVLWAFGPGFDPSSV